MFISTGISLLGAQPIGGGSALPDIETTNLVAWWDAGIESSYPGTGTTIFDLSGNSIDGELYGNTGPNTPVYTGSLGGALTFPAVSSCVRNRTNFLSGTKNWSVCIIGRFTNTTEYARLVGGQIPAGSGDVAIANSTTIRVCGSGGSQGFWSNVGTNSYKQNQVAMYTYQCDNTNPYLRSFWTNTGSMNVPNSASAGGGVTYQNQATTGVVFGSNENYSEGVIGEGMVCMVYNGRLTQTMVNKNYAAYASRYNW